MKKPVKIIIVEDEALIAADIEASLVQLGHLVVGKAMNGDKALDLLASSGADLAILDINLKGSYNGIDLANLIRKKYPMAFIFLTSYSDDTTLDMVKETLPYGYIVKPFNIFDLRSAVELAVHKYKLEAKSFPNAQEIKHSFGIVLSERDHDVLRLINDGKSYKEIADHLDISINTVKTYQKRLFHQFQVNSKYEILRLFT